MKDNPLLGPIQKLTFLDATALHFTMTNGFQWTKNSVPYDLPPNESEYDKWKERFGLKDDIDIENNPF